MTVGSAEITGIAFCDESSLVFSKLKIYTGQGSTAGHYPHVAHYSKIVWCFCVHLVYTCIYDTLYWDNLNYIEKYLYNIVCYHSAIQLTVNFHFCQQQVV